LNQAIEYRFASLAADDSSGEHGVVTSAVMADTGLIEHDIAVGYGIHNAARASLVRPSAAVFDMIHMFIN
jgi:hypothetical protein